MFIPGIANLAWTIPWVKGTVSGNVTVLPTMNDTHFEKRTEKTNYPEEKFWVELSVM